VFTCRGLVGLSRYLLGHCGFEYVPPGKEQSDKLEGHFSHLRKLAGGNYWGSARQFLEGEAVIRAKSLVWLSGYTLGTVAVEMRPVADQRRASDEETIQLLSERTKEADRPEEFPEGTEEALNHLGGYLAYSVRKKHKCSSCVELLANQHGKPPDEVRAPSDDTENSPELKGFTELLNRKRLMCPSVACIQLVKEVCLLYRNVTEDDSRTELFGTSNPKGVFQGIVAKRMKQNDDFCHIVKDMYWWNKPSSLWQDPYSTHSPPTMSKK